MEGWFSLAELRRLRAPRSSLRPPRSRRNHDARIPNLFPTATVSPHRSPPPFRRSRSPAGVVSRPTSLQSREFITRTSRQRGCLQPARLHVHLPAAVFNSQQSPQGQAVDGTREPMNSKARDEPQRGLHLVDPLFHDPTHIRPTLRHTWTHNACTTPWSLPSCVHDRGPTCSTVLQSRPQPVVWTDRQLRTPPSRRWLRRCGFSGEKCVFFQFGYLTVASVSSLRVESFGEWLRDLVIQGNGWRVLFWCLLVRGFLQSKEEQTPQTPLGRISKCAVNVSFSGE